MIKCSLCGFRFKAQDAKSACARCHLFKGCTLIKCPHCGFEMVPLPDWAKKSKKEEKE